jgi:hypothetical protein
VLQEVSYAIFDAADLAGLVLVYIAWLGARQPHHSGDIQRESTAGKIAWQYDTGG